MDRVGIKPFLKLGLLELVSIANKVRKDSVGSNIHLCSIMNAKSGLCSQDCKFCAQSSRYQTNIPVYRLAGKRQIFRAAQEAQVLGAERFGIVASGDSLKARELNIIADTIAEIIQRLGLKVCASLGRMNKDGFLLLKKAGLSRYHHNIESSPAYFPKIVHAHTFESKIETIKTAKGAGLEVCSGGIIGMGEALNDRIEMAFILRELDVDSVPINILVPIKGTPLEDKKIISCKEIIRTIALFRIILKDKTIKIAAGRESALRDFSSLAFLAGANGMLIGGYLTVKGRSIGEDRQLVDEVKKLWQE
ncbi:MAG: biotin synthase BioB [Candidatus Omnitrophota bacterium]|nr:biotin synthase BioB [Candidatus Omnitrophota bacterium]